MMRHINDGGLKEEMKNTNNEQLTPVVSIIIPAHNEEAATLVLAGQHLVDFVDFDIAEVIFFRKAKCSPVEIVLEYVFDRERGISSKAEEKYEEVCSGCEDVWMHHLDVWLGGDNN